MRIFAKNGSKKWLLYPYCSGISNSISIKKKAPDLEAIYNMGFLD